MGLVDKLKQQQSQILDAFEKMSVKRESLINLDEEIEAEEPLADQNMVDIPEPDLFR